MTNKMAVNISSVDHSALVCLIRESSVFALCQCPCSFTIYDKSHHTGHFCPQLSLIQGQRGLFETPGLGLFIFALLSSLLLSHIWASRHIIHYKTDIANLCFLILRNIILKFSRESYRSQYVSWFPSNAISRSVTRWKDLIL